MFGRCLPCEMWHHPAENRVFRNQQSLKPWARRNLSTSPSNCAGLRLYQKSMVQKPSWRKLHTKPKFFDLVKAVQHERQVVILTTCD